jgi:hypothetical protein
VYDGNVVREYAAIDVIRFASEIVEAVGNDSDFEARAIDVIASSSHISEQGDIGLINIAGTINALGLRRGNVTAAVKTAARGATVTTSADEKRQHAQY